MFSYLRRILSGVVTLICTAIAFIPFFMGTSTYAEFLKKVNLTNAQFALVCFFIFWVIIVYSVVIYTRTNKEIEQTGKIFSDFHQKMLETVFELRSNSDNYSEHTTVDEFYKKMQENRLFWKKETDFIVKVTELALQVCDMETTLEVNLAMLKFKHIVKRRKWCVITT